jgi:putative ABC transport system permease protein
VDLGFKAEGLLTASFALPSQRYADPADKVRFVQEMEEAVRALPGVTSVAFVSRLPLVNLGGNYRVWNLDAPPDPGARRLWADRRSVLPGYFQAMDIPVVEGRDLSKADVEGAPPVAVLSRSSADQLFPGQSPLGRQVAMDIGGSEPLVVEVVGVVADQRTYSLDSAARPTMFFPYAQLPEARLSLTVASADPMSVARPLQARIWEMDRDILLTGVRTMEDIVLSSISDTRSITTMLGLFALAAIALAALGLYSVLAFFVSRRTHEIGIRVALGATAAQVLRLVMARGLALAAAGAALGVLGSVWAVRAVRAMLFETSATDPTAVIGVTGFFLLVSLAACALPAWKALRVDPAEAFRAE